MMVRAEPPDMTLIYSSVFTVGFAKKLAPVDSIVETNIFEYHFENRGENIMTKDKLLEIGDRYEAQLAADRSADAPFR